MDTQAVIVVSTATRGFFDGIGEQQKKDISKLVQESMHKLTNDDDGRFAEELAVAF